jgi:hypothetical protein
MAMADNFIDLDETQIYGPHASKMIRKRVVGVIPEFDAGMTKLADDIDHATQALAEIVSASRDASSDVRKGTKGKGPVLADAVHALGRFSKHLDTQAQGIDRKAFFPEDGTASGVGKSADRVLIALGRVAVQLKKPTWDIRDKDHWIEQVTEAMNALAPLVEHSKNAKTERRSATPEVESARKAWMQVYTAAKSGVECVLRLDGSLHMLPTVFHDLAVSGGTKITEAPAEPPAEPPDPV